MTGMERAIEKAARVLIAHPSIPTYGDGSRDVCPSCPDAEVAGPNSPSHAIHQARALAEAGLLAPAPLREEWGSEVRHPLPDRPPQTLCALDRDNAVWQIENNPDYATGRVMHRYRTDWLPVNSDEEAGQ